MRVLRISSTMSVLDITGGEQADERIHRTNGNLNLRFIRFHCRTFLQYPMAFWNTLSTDSNPRLWLQPRFKSRQPPNLASRRHQHLLCITPLWLCRHRLFHHPRRSKCFRIQTAIDRKSNSGVLEHFYSKIRPLFAHAAGDVGAG